MTTAFDHARPESFEEARAIASCGARPAEHRVNIRMFRHNMFFRFHGEWVKVHDINHAENTLDLVAVTSHGSFAQPKGTFHPGVPIEYMLVMWAKDGCLDIIMDPAWKRCDKVYPQAVELMDKCVNMAFGISTTHADKSAATFWKGLACAFENILIRLQSAVPDPVLLDDQLLSARSMCEDAAGNTETEDLFWKNAAGTIDTLRDMCGPLVKAD